MAEDHPTTQLIPNGGWDPRVRVFRHGALVDTCAVVTERFVVVVDSGSDPESAARIMDGLADWLAGRHLLVLLTHADWDHAWGNRLFAGPDARYPAPILGHRLAAQRLRSAEERTVLADLQAQYPTELAQVQLIPPTLAFTPPLTIDGGDLVLEVIGTPGHQPDHVAVWIPALRFLWAGDAAEQPWPFANDPAALPALRESLARMAALDPLHALYCHAPGVTTPDLILRNAAYFDALEAHCRAALAPGTVGAAEAAADADPALLPARIGFPAAAALAPGLDPAVLTPAYVNAHARNMRVMLGWLLSNDQDQEAGSRTGAAS